MGNIPLVLNPREAFFLHGTGYRAIKKECCRSIVSVMNAENR
jgi:hypothetical protein